MWGVAVTIGLGTAFSGITGDAFGVFWVPFGGLALLAGLLFLGTVLQGLLEMAGEILVYAARREHVDLTKPD